MLTNRKQIMLSMTALGLVLGTIVMCLPPRQEALAQAGGTTKRPEPAAGQDAEREAVARTGQQLRRRV